MSTFFDESEYEEEPAPKDQVDQILSDLNTPLNEEQAVSEVERRVTLALYYREILKGSIFKDNSAEAQIVDKEIREFVRSRMEILVGIKADVQPIAEVKSPFTEEEVEALKAVAAKVLKRPLEQEAATVKPKPEINAISAPAKPQVKSPPAERPTTPSTKRPQPKTAKTKEDFNKIPDGEIFKHKGKVFKWETNELGTRYIRDVTPPARATGGIPIPNDQELSMISEQQSARAVQMTDSGLSSINKIAAELSIKNG